MNRIDLNAIPAGDRQLLADRILAFLNDDRIDDHMAIIHSGVSFFTAHRAYLGTLEAWLALNLGAQFVPLPEWDPANPIPAEFDVVKPQDDGTPRQPLQNLNPAMPMPADFAFPAVCRTTSLEQLANAVSGWHGGVHGAVGGAMGDLMNAPAAPIFWCWHAFLDDIYFDWQACATSGTDGQEPPSKGADEYEARKQEYEERRRYYDDHPDELHAGHGHIVREHVRTPRGYGS